MIADIARSLLLITCCAAAGLAQELRIACYDGYAPDELVERFVAAQKAAGRTVKVTVSIVSNNRECFETLRAGKVDVVSVGDNGVKNEKYRMIAGGLLQPIDTAKLTNYADLVPEFKMAAFISEGGKTYGVPMEFGPLALAYNVARFPTPPNSWKALFADGARFAVPSDLAEGNAAIAAMVAGVPLAKALDLAVLETPAVRGNLAHMAKRSERKWSGVDDADTLRGLDLAVSWGTSLPALAAEGETWKMAYPQEGSLGFIDSFAIGASCPPAARELAMAWLDFAISPESQAFYLRSINGWPTNLRTRDLLTPEEAVACHLDDPTWFRSHVTLFKVLDLRSENGLQKLWAEAQR